MIAAELLNAQVIAEIITVIGISVAGYLTYLGIKAQVQQNGHKIEQLDVLNTEQHGVNKRVLERMLDKIAEQGVLVSAVVNVQDRPIIKTDPSGALLQVNAAGVKLLGMAPHELTGDGWVKAVHIDDRERVFGEWTECIREKRPFGPVSYRYHHPVTGGDTLVEAVATPVVGADDEILSWIGVVVPITEV